MVKTPHATTKTRYSQIKNFKKRYTNSRQVNEKTLDIISHQVSVKVRLSGSVEVTRAIQSGTGISGITTPFGGTFRDFHKRGRAGVCH